MHLFYFQSNNMRNRTLRQTKNFAGIFIDQAGF